MQPEVDLWETRACYCLSARKAARAITRLYEEKLRPLGLRATQFSILAALALKGPTPLGDLADLLGLERTTLTRSAALLEEKGWLARGASDDAREHVLQLTGAGHAKLVAAFPVWREVQRRVGEQIAAGGWLAAAELPG